MTRRGEPVRPIDVFIVGAQKAGTSSLKQYLGSHPGLVTHDVPEIAFFINDEQFARGYAAMAPTYFGAAPSGRKVLAKSVSVLFKDETVARLHQHNPRMVPVVMLRDPVDRAHSAYWYARRMGWEAAPTFAAAIERAGPPDGAPPVVARNVAYMENGMYADQLERLFRRFRPDQCVVALMERFRSSPADVCREILSKAGLDAQVPLDITHVHNPASTARLPLLAAFLNRPSRTRALLHRLLPRRLGGRLKRRVRSLNERPFTPPPMEEALRRRLAEAFAGPNERLSRLTGLDVSHWGAGAAARRGR